MPRQLEARLDRAAAPGASLDTPALHRLNRTEYANAIRDLLAFDVDVATLLPADGSSEGFDNIAEALSVSPSLIQGYVSAAMKISRQAVGDRTLAPSQVTYSAPAGTVAGPAHRRPSARHPRRHAGSAHVSAGCRVRAQYRRRRWRRAGGGGAAIDVTIDGEKVEVANPRSFRLPITAGPHAIGVAIVDRQRGAGVDEIYSDFRIDAASRRRAACRRRDDHRAVQCRPASATRQAAAASSCAVRDAAPRRRAMQARDHEPRAPGRS